jgi:hypothetical protein
MKCNKYTILLPKNYKSRASRLKLNIIRQQQEENEKQRLKLLTDLQDAKKYRLKALHSELIARVRGISVQQQNEEIKQQEQKEQKEIPQIEGQTSNEIQIEGNCDPNSLIPPVTLPSLHRQESDGMLTSLYFTCGTKNCNSVQCLRCDTLLTITESNTHICNLDRIDELYLMVLDVLAEASVQRCPKEDCKTPGRKGKSKHPSPPPFPLLSPSPPIQTNKNKYK